jgi:A/G-specific adenine glycosylase
MMLQQTTVAVVIPYYERFITRFPDAASLAASEEDAVLALWSGLGYYSRARNLHGAARQLMADHAGLFPRDIETAMTLKGVGLYTASAVTSMAYGARAAVVDGNVRRVLSRLHAVRDPGPAKARAMARALLSTRSPGAWNEAMMELGATVCRPRKPLCKECPVASQCVGRDRAEHWSEGKARRRSVLTRVEMALVRRGGRVLLTRNPDGELMGGLFELPHSGLPLKQGRTLSLQDRYRGILKIGGDVVARFRHGVTHHRIEATVFRAGLMPGALRSDAGFYTVPEALSLPLGGLTRKALRAAGLWPA